jgi:hypothetical protein
LRLGRISLAGSIVALAVATAATPWSSAPRIVQSLRANLDADPGTEQAQVVDYTKPNPYGGTVSIHVEYGRVIDRIAGGLREIQVTPRVEHLGLRAVRDGAEDQRPDIWYWGSIGGAGAVPRFYGLVDWDGRKARVLWKYDARVSSVKRYSGAHATLFQDPAAQTSGYEIKLQEGSRRPGEPNCCASRARVSLYRFSDSRYLLYRRYFINL